MGTTTPNTTRTRMELRSWICLNSGSACRLALRTMSVPFVGFCSFITSVQLYENYLLLSDVSVFNFGLYGSLTQLLILASAGFLSLVRGWAPSVRLVQICALVAAVSMTIHLLSDSVTAGIVCSIANGASSAVLAVAWGPRLAEHPPRTIFILVLGALLISTVICLACFIAPSPLTTALAILLPTTSGALYTLDRARRTTESDPPKTGASARQDDHGDVHEKRSAALRSFPWPFLFILGTCCLISSFFVGVTMNPYSFQSNSVSQFMYLFTLLSFAILLAGALTMKRPKVPFFFIAVLALLLMGLFLFSTGLLGSIIMPLGLILTSKNCFLALLWITLATLARATKGIPAVALFGGGLLICNGIFGRSMGMLANSHGGLSFPDIALAASVCIVVFTLFYAFMVASHPGTNTILSPGLNGPLTMPIAEATTGATSSEEPIPEPTAQELMARARTMQEQALCEFKLTSQERRVARLILQDETYQQIAQACDISERTVKFHAKNVYKKAGVATRRDFMVKMLSGK